MPLFALLLVFLLVPLVELAVLIAVGTRIGVLSTVALCLLTAVVGAALVRAQGLAVLRSLRRELERGQLPVAQAFHGLCLLLAGALLLIPGFFTDLLGLLLLLPPVRRGLYELLRRRFLVARRGPRDVPPVLETEYRVIIDDEPPLTDRRRPR
ncbi:hypothetical protein HRbin40_01124 [bacterium HR40]|nr:hypothetical protein HRbin40_01124 [bacterium HR40]